MSTKQLSERASGVRRKIRRNRKISYPIGSVKTDGSGNILDRPLTEQLPCFADPVEWLWGQFDQPRIWGDKEPEPHRCAMCPVKAFCATVSWERIQSSSELRQLHEKWEQQTLPLTGDMKQKHPTWAALVTACERTTWSDVNERNQEEVKDAKRQEKRKQASKKSAAKRRHSRPSVRSVPPRILAKIQKYRDDRVADMMIKRQASSCPLWLRNRSPERCILIADAWQAREILEEGRRKASARAVVDWLIENGRLEPNPPDAMVQRVNEALKRADQLVFEREWPLFDAHAKPSLPNGGLNPSMITHLLEE